MKKTVLLIFSILLFLIPNVYAQDVFKSELFSADVVLKYRADINLSDKKAASIKAIHNDNISTFNSLKWDLDAAMRKLQKMLSAEKVKKDMAQAQMKEVMKLEDDLKMLRLNMLIDIKNELSARQQNQLRKLRTDVDMAGSGLIQPLNEDPRIVLKYEGNKDQPEPLMLVNDASGEHVVQSMEMIDPSDIESIEVLKGESAYDIYGDRGANGVVIVNLKKGVKLKIQDK